MKFKVLLSAAIIAGLLIGFAACKGKKGDEQSSKSKNDSIQVSDNKVEIKDEITFLQTFLNKYITLSGKEAQEFARKNLTEEFYSEYYESCNNQDNAEDLILNVLIDEKVEKIDRIEKGSEDPTSFLVYVTAKDSQGNEFNPPPFDMKVIKEDGNFKLADSEIYD